MKVYWTDFAKQSLKEVYHFYRKNASEKVAKRIKAQIFFKTKLLEQQSKVGQIEPFLEEIGLDHRYILSGNFKIIYLIQGDSIFITDLFDTRRNPEKINDPTR